MVHSMTWFQSENQVFKLGNGRGVPTVQKYITIHSTLTHGTFTLFNTSKTKMGLFHAKYWNQKGSKCIFLYNLLNKFVQRKAGSIVYSTTLPYSYWINKWKMTLDTTSCSTLCINETVATEIIILRLSSCNRLLILFPSRTVADLSWRKQVSGPRNAKKLPALLY